MVLLSGELLPVKEHADGRVGLGYFGGQVVSLGMGRCLKDPGQGLIPSPHSIHMHTLLLVYCPYRGHPHASATLPLFLSSAAFLDTPARAYTQTQRI